MIVQFGLVVGGIASATACVLTGHQDAGAVIGGICGFLFFMTLF